MQLDENEEELLRSVALQNAQAILLARERAERALLETKEALERKTTELAEQRESFRVTLSSIGDAVITTDIEARLTFLNPVAEAMTGWKSSEAIGQPLEKVFHIVNEQTRQPAPSPVAKVLRDGTIVGLANHTSLISRDGRETAIDDSAAPIRDASGKICGVVMVFHDVTKQRQAEVLLKESRERLQAALNAAGTGTFRWNLQTNAVEFDQNLDRLFGLAAGQTIRSLESFLATVHAEDRSGVAEACDRCVRNGDDFEMEFRIVWPDGSVHWLHDRGKTFFDEAGKPAYITGACADVTERKRADEIRFRLAEVVESTDDAIISKNLDGIITTWNLGAQRMFGYVASEVIGKPVTILMPPDHLDEEPGILQRLKRGERIDHYETTRQRKDGAKLHVSLTVSPIKDANGRIIGASKIARDITQRKQAEVERARLTSVLERSLNEIYIFDTETLRFEYVNEGARRNLGFSMDEMRQKTPLDIKPEFTEAIFREMVKPLLLGEQERHLFYTVHRRADGTDYPVEVHLQAVAHAGQRVFLAVILDITERKKAEAERRRNEEELRALANSIPQLAWMAEADGNIFWYNHRWHEYTGTTLKEMQGWGWQSVHDPKMLPRVVERWNHSLNTGQPFDMEFPLRGADGIFRWFLTRVSPVRDSDGRIVRWFGTNTDVDEVRRTREALREAQEKLSRYAEDLENQVALRTASLREAISQLEEFSYSVSHDLRAPIRAIGGYTRIFRSDYGTVLAPEALVFLDKISRSTARMERLVNDVLTMSRVARADIQLHPVALQHFIEEILEQHAEMQAPSADISIAAPHVVIADDASLGQAISNLLANAVKFVPKGAKPIVKIHSEQEGERVKIWVEDNGIGIPPEHRSKLFGMFQRLPTNLQYEGTGIGLAIVRKAVERMGGTVGIESNQTGGSRFWVELKGQP